MNEEVVVFIKCVTFEEDRYSFDLPKKMLKGYLKDSDIIKCCRGALCLEGFAVCVFVSAINENEDIVFVMIPGDRIGDDTLFKRWNENKDRLRKYEATIKDIYNKQLFIPN